MRHVLYVDDEPALCKAFERAFRGGDIRVITTTSALVALDMVASYSFDMVISDLRMPGWDGLQLLRAVRQHDADITRLLVSGESEQELGPLLREAGIDHFVSKPWSLDQLRDVVRRALSRSHSIPGSGTGSKKIPPAPVRVSAVTTGP